MVLPPFPARQQHPFLSRLRSETAGEHWELERDLELLGPKLEIHWYQGLLERFYTFYEPWEASLRVPVARHLPALDPVRWKAPRLVADLSFFGTETSALIRCSDLPACNDLATLLGSLYVSEGATLGGQIIARQLESRLALKGGRGYSFFSSYGANVSSMWRDFQRVLTHHTPPGEEHTVIAAAKQTFTCMHRWLCDEPPNGLSPDILCCAI